MNLKQYVIANDLACELMCSRTWMVSLDVLPKLERIAHAAFDQLRAMITSNDYPVDGEVYRTN